MEKEKLEIICKETIPEHSKPLKENTYQGLDKSLEPIVPVSICTYERDCPVKGPNYSGKVFCGETLNSSNNS